MSDTDRCPCCGGIPETPASRADRIVDALIRVSGFNVHPSIRREWVRIVGGELTGVRRKETR